MVGSVIPAVGCSFFSEMAKDAFIGALIGATSGVKDGVVSDALEYYQEKGTIDGASSKIANSVLERLFAGFAKGSAAGAAH